MELEIAEVSLPRSRTSPSQPYLPNPPCGRRGSLHRSKPVANEILDLGPQVPTLECKNLRLRPTKARPRACRDIAPSALELSIVPYQTEHACRPRYRQPFMGSRHRKLRGLSPKRRVEVRRRDKITRVPHAVVCNPNAMNQALARGKGVPTLLGHFFGRHCRLSR